MPETIAPAELGMAVPDEPGERECLRCYLARTLPRHGCDNTRRWTERWRDRRFPANVQLLTDLEDRGGICCDCEVTMNVWEPDDVAWDEEEEARPLAPCDGTASEDPLELCARWAGWSLREPGDPYEDEDDDYELRYADDELDDSDELDDDE
jgi:Protein of unknown function (DUF2695)